MKPDAQERSRGSVGTSFSGLCSFPNLRHSTICKLRCGCMTLVKPQRGPDVRKVAKVTISPTKAFECWCCTSSCLRIYSSNHRSCFRSALVPIASSGERVLTTPSSDIKRVHYAPAQGFRIPCLRWARYALFSSESKIITNDSQAVTGKQ